MSVRAGAVGGAAAVLLYVPCRRRPDPAQATAVAETARALGVRAVVVVTSTEVYEPSHRSPGLIDEARLAPATLSHPVARRWWQVEEAVRRAARSAAPRLPTLFLRAAPVPFPGGDDWASDLLSGPWATTLPGYDPPMQLLAPTDLATAVLAALDLLRSDAADPPDTGTGSDAINVVPAEVVPLSWALRLAGVRKLPVPQWQGPSGVGDTSGGAAAASHPVGVSAAPLRHDGRLAYLRHPWTASGEAARRDLGFSAASSSADTAAAFAAPDRGCWVPESRTPVPRVSLSFDDFGFSPRYVAGFDHTLFRFLHDAWWRVEVRGVERVPRQGAAVLVGVHRGFMPWDGVMALHLLRREVGRTPRFLVHPSLVKFPFLANYMRRLGGIIACEESSHHVLDRDGVLAIFPEGIRGAFLPYRDAHRLSRWFRRDYVRFAIAHGAPILPFATLGSAEIYPILGRLDWRWWRRLAEWPYLPLTPTFPLLPVPLPSKWHTWFLEPVDVTERYPPEAAEDPEVVREVGEEVEARLQGALDEMRRRRRSWWRGRIWQEGGEG